MTGLPVLPDVKMIYANVSGLVTSTRFVFGNRLTSRPVVSTTVPAKPSVRSATSSVFSPSCTKTTGSEMSKLSFVRSSGCDWSATTNAEPALRTARIHIMVSNPRCR